LTGWAVDRVVVRRPGISVGGGLVSHHVPSLAATTVEQVFRSRRRHSRFLHPDRRSVPNDSPAAGQVRLTGGGRSVPPRDLRTWRRRWRAPFGRWVRYR